MENFREIANFCVERFRNSHASDHDEYVQTIYVTIDEENEVVCSTTPHALRNAKSCILLHVWRAIAVTNWYTWYKVEYIDNEGGVTDGYLGDGFRLYSTWYGNYNNKVMRLEYSDTVIFECESPFENQMQKIWNVYRRAKKAKSEAALNLMKELIEQDERILEQEREIANLNFTNILLEKQKNQYRRLLRDIREMVDELNSGRS